MDLIEPYLMPLLVGMGVYFMGNFTGKRFNLSQYSCLGLALISFSLAFICHRKSQDVLLSLFPLIDRHAVVLIVIGVCVVVILLIALMELKKKPTLSPDLYPSLYDYYTSVEKYVNMYDIIGIQNRLKDQNQKLEKLEKALDHENVPKPISNKIEMLKQKKKRGQPLN